jgi:hypothetical protein
MLKVFLLFLLLIPIHLFSQEVIFCEQVDKFGNPKNAATEFTITSEGGFFKILVKLKKEVNASNIIFDVYKLKDTKEVFDNSLKMEVKPGVTWFYKEITFFKEGTYVVYVYDERDKLLGVGKVLIKY